MISVAPRKLLILAFILVLLFLYAYSTFGISSKTLNSLCSSTHVQQVFPGPQRPSGEASMYSTQSEDAVHWTQDDIAAESSKMVNTDKLLRGNATLHFRGTSSVKDPPQANVIQIIYVLNTSTLLDGVTEGSQISLWPFATSSSSHF